MSELFILLVLGTPLAGVLVAGCVALWRAHRRPLGHRLADNENEAQRIYRAINEAHRPGTAEFYAAIHSSKAFTKEGAHRAFGHLQAQHQQTSRSGNVVPLTRRPRHQDDEGNAK